jgi:diguanylate cyclase
MQVTPYTARQRDRIDQATGLPRLPTALVDLPSLIRDNNPDLLLGIIALAVVPDPLFFRQSADAMHRIRLELSQRIVPLLRSQDRLYAISQREWLIVQPNLISSASLPLAMIRLRDSLATQAGETRVTYQPQLALGSARWPEDGSDPLFLLQSARMARMFAEKSNLRFQTYNPEMESEGDDEQGLLNELRIALRDNEGLALFLQPQIETATARCIGAEALLRWQRANGDWIAPPRILEAIDRLGLRQTFNRWLIHQTAQIQLQLADQGIDIVLSINLSANDLLDMELPDMLGQMLATWDITPARILLEITETVMVDESWQVLDVLDRMRKLGVRLSIDDFGTGYAGMSYLQRLPVQEVKIDQMFVRELGSSDKALEIVTAIIQLATRLHMSVIAEGVETTEILDILSGLGCRFAQGFLFSKAIPVTDFIAWYQANLAKMRLIEKNAKSLQQLNQDDAA